MSELKPLFVDLDDTYGADELGLPYRDIVGEGYVSGLAVSQRAAGINLSVDVAAGSCWVQGDTDTSAQPTYRCRNDAVVNLGITPDATNPRNVIVVAEVLDDAFDGGGSLLWRLRAVHGTAAASPVDPATPTSSIVLARIAVTAADASIADAQITDLRAPANFGGGNIKLWAKGTDIASAATIAVTHPFHDVTGTVTITSITAQSAGFVVTLQFDGVLTFTDGSNLKIGGNFTTAAESTITLVCDGTNWYELSRSPTSVTTEYDVLTKVTTAVTVVNTITETNLINYTIPGGTIGTDKLIHARLGGHILQESGANQALSLGVYLGATTLYLDKAPVYATPQGIGMPFTDADRRPFHIDVWIRATGAANSQFMEGVFVGSIQTLSPTTGYGAGADTSTQARIATFSSAGRTAVDMASGQALRVTVRLETAHASYECKVEEAQVAVIG